MQKELGAKGLQVISVSIDRDKADAGVFAKEVRATFPVVLDPKAALASKYGVQALPTNVIIGRNGKVAALVEGADVRALEAAVKKALGVR